MRWMDEWMHGCMGGLADECLEGCIDEWMKIDFEGLKVFSRSGSVVNSSMGKVVICMFLVFWAKSSLN